MGLLEPVEAVLPAARRRAVDVLLGGGSHQHPLLVLHRGLVGRWCQELCRVVGARWVRVVGRIRCIRSMVQENPTVVFMGREGLGRGVSGMWVFWEYFGVETAKQEMGTKYRCAKTERAEGRRTPTQFLPLAAEWKVLQLYPITKAAPEVLVATLKAPAASELLWMYGLSSQPSYRQRIPPKTEKSKGEVVSKTCSR